MAETERSRSYYVLFAVYFAGIVVGEAGLLASVCVHYEAGWVTWQTALAVFGCLVSVAALGALWGRAKRSAASLFLLVGAPLLAGYALFMMPFAVPDEFTHINRLFDIRSGVCPLEVPAQLRDAEAWIGPYSSLQTCFDISFDYTQTRLTENCASAYSTINYLLPSLAVALGKPLGINAYVLVFAARLINAALYLGACYWMLRTIPFGKKLAFVFLLNPMLLQQEASCSADALCNIAVLCFFVQVLAIRFGEGASVPRRAWAMLALFAVLVALCKYAYLPLVLSAVILYPKIQSRRVRRILPLASIVLIAMVAVLVYCKGYSIMLDRLLAAFDPEVVFSSLGATIMQEGETLVWQFAGGNLGWPYMNGADATTTVRVPMLWIGYLLVLALAFVSSLGEKEAPFRIWERVFLVCLGVLESFFLFLALWEAHAAASAVTWIQGRYFIPPVFVMLCALVLRLKTPLAKLPAALFAGAVALINAGSLVYVIRFFL